MSIIQDTSFLSMENSTVTLAMEKGTARKREEKKKALLGPPRQWHILKRPSANANTA